MELESELGLVSGPLLYCILLHCIILHYILYYLILYYIILYYIILNIPLISQVRGPYGKLWIKFFPSFYSPSTRAIKTRKEKTRIHNLPYGPRKRG